MQNNDATPTVAAPEWTCVRQRDHGFCKTVNEVGEPCGACGAEQPAVAAPDEAGLDEMPDAWLQLRLDDIKDFTIRRGATPTSPIVRDIEQIAHGIAALVTAKQEAHILMLSSDDETRRISAENARLRATLAERERDAARLDWLEQHSWQADNDGDLKGPREMPKLYVGRDRSTPPITAHTMRAAIDNAIDAVAATPTTEPTDGH